MADGWFPKRAFIQQFEGKYVDTASILAARGVEVIPLSSEEMIRTPPKLERSDLVVGDFDWTNLALKQLGVKKPIPPDYPSCLSDLLHRKIWQSTLGAIAAEVKATPGFQVFIKPAEDTKVFSAIIEPKDQMIDTLISGIPGCIDALPESTPVHCAELVTMVSEYRVYVVNGEIREVCRYKGPDDDKLDLEVVRGAVKSLTESEEYSHLKGYGVDFAVIQKTPEAPPITALIEVNDGYSLGKYAPLSGQDYTDLLVARWGTLVS
eukprot:Hpha_TRINITY_DN15743_c1_g9::TRINITY_DN15743_c1_g9_i1::g.40100::m.40100